MRQHQTVGGAIGLAVGIGVVHGREAVLAQGLGELRKLRARGGVGLPKLFQISGGAPGLAGSGQAGVEQGVQALAAGQPGAQVQARKAAIGAHGLVERGSRVGGQTFQLLLQAGQKTLRINEQMLRAEQALIEQLIYVLPLHEGVALFVFFNELYPGFNLHGLSIAEAAEGSVRANRPYKYDIKAL